MFESEITIVKYRRLTHEGLFDSEITIVKSAIGIVREETEYFKNVHQYRNYKHSSRNLLDET
jgi:hypothetical protein